MTSDAARAKVSANSTFASSLLNNPIPILSNFNVASLNSFDSNLSGSLLQEVTKIFAKFVMIADNLFVASTVVGVGDDFSFSSSSSSLICSISEEGDAAIMSFFEKKIVEKKKLLKKKMLLKKYIFI